MANLIIRYPGMNNLSKRMSLNCIVLAVIMTLQVFYGLMKLVTKIYEC